MLIDGHLRAETEPDALVPVLVLDVNEAEADKLLVTLDPLAGLAEVDQEKLNALLPNIETSSAALQQMLDKLAGNPATLNAEEAEPEGPDSIPEQWRILIECQSEAEQDALLARFQTENLKCRALVI